MKKFIAVAATIGAAALMGACGGGGSGDSGGAAISTNAGARAEASGSADVNDFCAAQAAAQNKAATVDANNPGAAIAEAEKQLKENGPKIKAGLKAAVAAAPSEIKADVKTVTEASLPYYDALEKVDYDISKVDFADKALAGITAPNVLEAAKRVAAFYEEKCAP